MISLQRGDEMLGRGLGCEVACMCRLGIFLWLGLAAVVYTINKCIRDLPLSSKGGQGMCPDALAFSLLADHETCKQQVGNNSSCLFLFFSFVLESGLQGSKTSQPQKGFARQLKDSHEGFFPKFLLQMCGSLLLCYPAASS